MTDKFGFKIYKQEIFQSSNFDILGIVFGGESKEFILKKQHCPKMHRAAVRIFKVASMLTLLPSGSLLRALWLAFHTFVSDGSPVAAWAGQRLRSW